MDRNVHFSTLEPRSPRNSQAYPPQEIWKIVYIHYIHIYSFIFFTEEEDGVGLYLGGRTRFYLYRLFFWYKYFFVFFILDVHFFYLLRFEFAQVWIWANAMIYTRRTHAQARRRTVLVGVLTLLLPVVVLLVSSALARGRGIFLDYIDAA